MKLLPILSAVFIFAMGFSPYTFAQEAEGELTPAIDETAPAADMPVEAVPAEPADAATPVEPATATEATTQEPAPETPAPETPAVETPSVPADSSTDATPETQDAAALGNAVDGGPVSEAMQPPVDFSKMNSIFFTKWEHDLLVETRLGTVTRPVIPGTPDVEMLVNPNVAPIIDSPREISLSGITYVSSKDWVVWLNGTRVSPTAIPSTVMDLRVYKDHIDLEWLDRTTNQIYPIRLRTNQKFNLDTRMFLPSDG